jgi:hypothetical protein
VLVWDALSLDEQAAHERTAATTIAERTPLA